MVSAVLWIACQLLLTVGLELFCNVNVLGSILSCRKFFVLFPFQLLTLSLPAKTPFGYLLLPILIYRKYIVVVSSKRPVPTFV